MSEAARLEVIVSASGVSKVKGELAGVNASAASAAKGALKATAALAGIGGAAAAIRAVTQQTVGFDRSMRNVNSIAQLNERQFGKLEKSVLRLSDKTAQAPVTLADGLYDLVSSGFNAAESVKILSSSARAATAGLTDTATSTKAVAAVLNAYHLRASAAGKVSDDLFQTVNLGVLSFEELAQNIGDVLPFASALHVGLKQVGAATATMTKAGVSAPETMTRIKSTMSALIKPSDDLRKSYQQLGVSSGEELIKKTGSLQGALQALSGSVGGNKEALAKLFPDIRAMGGALLLTGQNAKSANEDLKAFGNDKGATKNALSQQAKSVSYQVKQMGAELSSAAIQIGSKLIPVMSGAAHAVAGFVSDMMAGKGAGGEFADAIGTVAHAVGTFASQVASVVGPVAGLIGDLIPAKAAIVGIASAFAGFYAAKTAIGIIQGIGTALAFVRANPVLAAVTAVSGLIGVLAGLGAGEDAEARQARLNAEAHKAQADAIKSVSDAERAAADKGLAAKQSTLDLKRAHLEVAAALKEHGKGSLEYKQAVLNEQQATMRASGAHKDYATQLRTEKAEAKGLVDGARERMKVAQDEAAGLVKYARERAKSGANVTTDPAYIRATEKATGNLVNRTQEYIQAVARANVSDTNRNRLMNASKSITADNVRGVAAFVNKISGLPKSKQTKLLLQNQDAMAKIGNSIDRLQAYGKTKALARILANNDDAKSKISQILALINSLHDKTVTVTTQYKQVGNGPARAGLRSADGIVPTADEAYLARQQSVIDKNTSLSEKLQAAFDRRDYYKQHAKLKMQAGRKLIDTAGLKGEKLSKAQAHNQAVRQARGDLGDLNQQHGRDTQLSRREKIIAAAQARIDARQKQMERPTAADYATSDISTSQARGDLTGMQSAATALVAARFKEYADAVKTNDPRKIAQAADNLTSASQILKQAGEDIKNAAETVRDNTVGKDDAAYIAAQINTPNNTADDKAALVTEQTHAKDFWQAAVDAGDTEGQRKWGSLFLSLGDAIKNLDNTVQDNTAVNQEQIDILKAQVQDAQRSANTANAQFGAVIDWISSGMGQQVLRRSTTPAAGRMGSL